RHDDDRNLGMLTAKIEQARQTFDTGHRQIEQHQVDVAYSGNAGVQLFERSSLDDLSLAERGAERLAQCATEQWVVVHDDYAMTQHRKLLPQGARGRNCRYAPRATVASTRENRRKTTTCREYKQFACNPGKRIGSRVRR